MTRDRAFWVRRAGPVLALVVAGTLLVAFGDGVVAIAGSGVIGAAAVLATALVFLEVGLSEDRERARERARPDERPPRR